MKQIKEGLTVSIPKALIDKIRNLVYWTPGLTISGLVRDYFENLVKTMEKERGVEFPPRTRQLRPGRPLNG